MKDSSTDIELAQKFAHERDYASAVKKYLAVIQNESKKKSSSYHLAISNLNHIKNHIQIKSLTEFETQVNNHPDGYVLPMMITDAVNGIRSLITLEEKKQDELILRIPMSLIVTQHEGMNSHLGSALKTANINLNFDEVNVYLVLSILLKIQNEPNHILANLDNWMEKNTCLYWDDNIIEQLQGSHLKGEVEALKNNARLDYKNLATFVDGFSDLCDFDRFQCLISQTVSRCISFDIDGIEHACMIPIGDFLNHDKDPNATWIYNENNDCFEVFALKNISPAEPLTIRYYHDPANADLLLDYGFCLDESKNDYLILENGIFLNNDPTHNDFLGMWEENIDYFIQQYHCNRLSAQLQLFGLVRNKLNLQLKRYRTTLADDEIWLSTNNCYDSNYYIRKTLFLEKKLLHQWLKVCQSVIDSVRLPQKQKEALIQSWSDATQGPELYLKHFWQPLLFDMDDTNKQ